MEPKPPPLYFGNKGLGLTLYTDVNCTAVYTGNAGKWALNGNALTLNGFSYTTTAANALYLLADCTIQLEGDSTLECTDGKGSRNGIIAPGVALTIENKAGATGSLTVKAGASTNSTVTGIAADTFTLNSGTVNATAAPGANGSCGVNIGAAATFTINGGRLNATSTSSDTNSFGMVLTGPAVINAGTIIAQVDPAATASAALAFLDEPTGKFKITGGATSADAFELVRNTSGATAYMYVVKSSGVLAQYAKIAAGETPVITGVSASPETLGTAGGASTVTVSGIDLLAGVTVTAFDSASASSITGTTDASGKVTLTFPANTSTTADKVYTIKASLDGGSTWATATAIVTVLKNAPTHADPKDDTVTKGNNITGSGTAADPYVTMVGKTFSLTVAGDRQDAPGSVAGDTRNIPTNWSINPSGTFTTAPYTVTASIANPGTYTLTVNYRTDRWDGATWVDAGAPYAHTYTVRVDATPAPAPGPNPEQPATPTTTGGSPQTGDSSNMGLWILLLTMATATLVGTVITIWKRKNINNNVE